MKKNYYGLFVFFLILSFICPLTAETTKEISKLIVRGEATIFKPADQLHLSLGVITREQNAEQALKSNNEKMQSVLAALKKIGLEEAEYQTGRFSIEPIYSPPPKNPPNDWKSVITGYEVTNKIAIKTLKLNSAGSIIDTASGAGANSVDTISFGLKDPQTYRAEAILAAEKQAMDDALILAKAANVDLVRFVEISLDNTFPSPRAVSKFMAMENAATSIQPGDVEVKASVNLIYEIKSH
jgi:uncharacterized protein